MSGEQHPPWFDQSRFDVPAPFVHLAIALLARASATADATLCWGVEPVESAMTGCYGGVTAEQRCGVGVAQAVAKATGTSAEHEMRMVLMAAGVHDWGGFITEHVLPNSAPYGDRVASFHRREEYRWVDVAELPVPHNPYRLPGHLAATWSKLERRTRWPQPLRYTREQLRERWVEQSRDQLLPDPAASWEAVRPDWEAVVARARLFWHSETVRWDRASIEEFSEDLAAPERIGFRSLFFEPIVYAETATELTNGQHRALVLRGQGVRDVLVCRI